MNKIEFRKMLNYLRSHPSDAKLLADIITDTGERNRQNAAMPAHHAAANEDDYQPDVHTRGTVTWLSAREAGKRIGKSSTWIRRRFREGLFRNARHDARGRYMFMAEEILNDYHSYVMARTRTASPTTPLRGEGRLNDR